MSLELVETSFLLNELTKNKGEQFLVVAGLGDVFPETLSQRSGEPLTGIAMHQTYPFESLLDRQLLGINKATNSDRDGQVNIICADIFSETHLRAGLRHANHALQMTDSNRIRACGYRLSPEICKEARNFFLVHVVKLWSNFLSSVHNVLPENILRYKLKSYGEH
jgi:hypothetical protein